MLSSGINKKERKVDLDRLTWESFKTKRTNSDLYTDNAVVMYVPTSVGVRGNAQIRRFFLNPQFGEKHVLVQESVFTSILADHRLFEEAVWTVHFYKNECNWLVPRIEERFLINATIKFPMTTSVSFDKETHQIESIRYSWDQACVLKQLRVISDKVDWPIIGEQQTDSLSALDKVQLKDLNGETVNQQGNTQQDTSQPSITGRNIFTYQPPPERRLVAPTNKLNSSFTFAHDDGSTHTLTTKMSQTVISPVSTTGKATPRMIIG